MTCAGAAAMGRALGLACLVALAACSTRPKAINMCVPPVVAILAASILVCMPPRESSEGAAPAIVSISGVTWATYGM